MLAGGTAAFFRAVEHVVGKPKQSVDQSLRGPLEVRWREDRIRAARPRLANSKRTMDGESDNT
jgi:hypothetical protein